MIARMYISMYNSNNNTDRIIKRVESMLKEKDLRPILVTKSNQLKLSYGNEKEPHDIEAYFYVDGTDSYKKIGSNSDEFWTGPMLSINPKDREKYEPIYRKNGWGFSMYGIFDIKKLPKSAQKKITKSLIEMPAVK